MAALALKMAELAWFAIRIRGNRERHVLDAFERLELESYAPTYREYPEGQANPAEKPLFPGYLFARLGVPDLAKTAGIPGVLQILGPTLRDEEIEAVRAVCRAMLPAPASLYAIGQTVTVLQSPLSGFKGVVAYVKSGGRVVITATLLNRMVSIELPVAYVTPRNADG